EAPLEETTVPGPVELLPMRLTFSHAVLFDVRAFDAVAEAQGFYAEEGVEIVQRDFTSGGADAIQSLVSGGTDLIVGVGVFAAYSAIQQGAALSIASAQNQGYGDLVYYVDSKSDITSFDGASGAKVAISRPGATTDLVCRELANQLVGVGQQANSCETIGSPPDIYTAATTGQVDIGWTVPPFFLDKIVSGEIRQIGSGNDVARIKGTTARVNLISNQFLDSNLETARRFFRAYERALDWMYDNRDETIKIWSAAAEIEVDATLIDAIFAAYPRDAFDLRSLVGLDVSLDAALALEFLESELTEADVQAATVIDRLFSEG
ncbi:MAG: ABC transporter substrate-binding protein, partial [Ilumatobacteraceae bacterium]